jgi:hypothetical protein
MMPSTDDSKHRSNNDAGRHSIHEPCNDHILIRIRTPATRRGDPSFASPRKIARWILRPNARPLTTREEAPVERRSHGRAAGNDQAIAVGAARMRRNGRGQDRRCGRDQPKPRDPARPAHRRRRPEDVRPVGLGASTGQGPLPLAADAGPPPHIQRRIRLDFIVIAWRGQARAGSPHARPAPDPGWMP